MFQDSCTRKVVTAVGVMVVIALAAYTYFTLKQARYIASAPTVISVTGRGEITAVPDVSTFTFTVEGKDVSASVAQSKAAETMNGILAYLKEAGVEEKDVRTESYNLSPEYEYPQQMCTEWRCPPVGNPKLIGYQASQNVSVKVRDPAKAGEVLSKIGEKGAQNVSGLSFTIDDEEKYKTEARVKAIADAKENAKTLAENLGVRLARMTGFSEEGNFPIMYNVGGASMKAYDSAESASVAPEIPTGENKVVVQVTLMYEVR